MKQKKTTVLIVDNDEDERFFLGKAFEGLSKKYIIRECGDGDEAVAYLEGQGKFADRSEFPFPSYIITDLHMSPGDGFQILDFIKLHPALSIIPLVMLSSSDHVDDIRTAYFLGASSYILKPNSQTALCALVKKIHDYWSECEIPQVDESGFALATNSKGRAGERFPKPKRKTEQKEAVH